MGGLWNGHCVDKSVAHLNALQRTSMTEGALDKVEEMTHSVDVSQPLSQPPWYLFSGSTWHRWGTDSKDTPSPRQTEVFSLPAAETNTDSPPMCRQTPEGPASHLWVARSAGPLSSRREQPFALARINVNSGQAFAFPDCSVSVRTPALRCLECLMHAHESTQWCF